MASHYKKLLALIEKRKLPEGLTPREAAELINLSNQIVAADPSVGEPGTIDIDALIARTGQVDTGIDVVVRGPSVDNDEHVQRIKQDLIEEAEARKKAIDVVAGVLLGAARVAITGGI